MILDHIAAVPEAVGTASDVAAIVVGVLWSCMVTALVWIYRADVARFLSSFAIGVVVLGAIALFAPLLFCRPLISAWTWWHTRRHRNRVYGLLARGAPRTAAQIRRELALPGDMVDWCLAHLEGDGLVTCEGGGSSPRWRLQ